MKARRFPLIVLLVGLLLSVVGLVLPIILIRTGGAATGIIGGADAPTYWFALTNIIGGLPFCIVLLGWAMTLTSLPAVIFHKTFQRICSPKTSGIAMGLSAIGGFGLTCAFYCYALAAFNEHSKHPIGYPLSLAAGMIAFCAFLLLICFYFMARGKKPSILGFIYDVICSIVYLPAFFFLSSFISELF